MINYYLFLINFASLVLLSCFFTLGKVHINIFELLNIVHGLVRFILMHTNHFSESDFFTSLTYC